MPFSPSDVAGLFGWWKADTIALSDNDTVTTWADSSGNSRDLTAVGAPIYKTAGLGGQPTVRLPGTATNYLYRDSMTLSQPCTMFWVARRTAATSSTGVMLSATPSPDVAMFILSDQTFGVFTTSGGFDVIAAAAEAVGHVFQVRIDGASGTAGVDGAGSTFDLGTDSPAGITVGAKAARNAEWFDGDIAEIIWYSGAVGTSDASDIRSYLAAKYGMGPATGSGSGTFDFVGTAAGTTAHDGSGTGTFAFTGAASGTTDLSGAGTGSFTFTGAAAGSAVHSGVGGGGWDWVGAASGSHTGQGSGTGTFDFAGAASGTAPPVDAAEGAGAGSVVFAGAASGSTDKSGTGAGTFTFAGAADGYAAPTGAGVGAFSYLGVAAGQFTAEGTGAGSWAFVGAGVGGVAIHMTIYTATLSAPTIQGVLS